MISNYKHCCFYIFHPDSVNRNFIRYFTRITQVLKLYGFAGISLTGFQFQRNLIAINSTHKLNNPVGHKMKRVELGVVIE